MDGLGHLPHGVLNGGDVRAGHGLDYGQHPVQHVPQVHGGGAGAVEVVPVLLALSQEVGVACHLGLEGQDVEGVAGKDADGRGPPHPQGGDGLI